MERRHAVSLTQEKAASSNLHWEREIFFWWLWAEFDLLVGVCGLFRRCPHPSLGTNRVFAFHHSVLSRPPAPCFFVIFEESPQLTCSCDSRAGFNWTEGKLALVSLSSWYAESPLEHCHCKA